MLAGITFMLVVEKSTSFVAMDISLQVVAVLSDEILKCADSSTFSSPFSATLLASLGSEFLGGVCTLEMFGHVQLRLFLSQPRQIGFRSSHFLRLSLQDAQPVLVRVIFDLLHRMEGTRIWGVTSIWNVVRCWPEF